MTTGEVPDLFQNNDDVENLLADIDTDDRERGTKVILRLHSCFSSHPR